MKRIAPAVALAIGFGAAAMAADMPLKTMAPTATPAFSWTGCYIGGHVGGMKNDSNLSARPDVGFAPDWIAANTYAYGASDSDFTAGVQYGCNRQYGQWILGLDSSFSWSGLDQTINANHTLLLPLADPYTERLSQKLDWYSTTRGRVGWTSDRWMIFAAGGLATGRVESSYVANFPLVPSPIFIGSQSKSRYGWTIGGGLEYALNNNWWLRGEYLYVDLGKQSYSSFAAATPTLTYRTDVDTQFHVARVALSYRFTTAGSLLEWVTGGFK